MKYIPSTLYGINNNNKLIAVKTYKNSFASCYPAWDYFENKYFGKEVTTMIWINYLTTKP